MISGKTSTISSSLERSKHLSKIMHSLNFNAFWLKSENLYIGILKKLVGRVWTGFTWLRIESSGGKFWTQW